MGNAFLLKVEQPFGADRLADAFSGLCGVDADNEELTDGIFVYQILVDLGPAEASDLSVMCTEKETCGIKPRFVHSILKVRHHPISLVGVLGKDKIVQIKPRL